MSAKVWLREDIYCQCDSMQRDDSWCPVHGDTQHRAPWICKDGRRLPIEQMSDRHLLNTIKMIERRYAVRILSYLEGPMPRGDMAQDAFEMEFDAVNEGGPTIVTPQYETLVDEADGRKIDDPITRGERVQSYEMQLLGHHMSI